MAAGDEYVPDWWDAEAYEPLLQADRSLFAWEWLRRDRNYRAAAERALDAASRERSDPAEAPERWGLHAFEPPARTAPEARPVWSASVHPYVLLNYQGRIRDVMTLAHELGHGVHQVLAAPQGALMSQTPLTLAETASVFGEMLTFHKLLDETRDRDQKRAMLAAKVEDMINTVVRQIAFYTFEREVHTKRKEGELTTADLNKIWLDIGAESLGPGIKLNEGYDIFWAYIPHFIHSPFYVYAYAFGDCLVNSLYAQYEKSNAGFAERYFDLLKAGGSKHHSELLAPFGLDATQREFWQKGLKVLERMIDELEGMQ